VGPNQYFTLFSGKKGGEEKKEFLEKILESIDMMVVNVKPLCVCAFWVGELM